MARTEDDWGDAATRIAASRITPAETLDTVGRINRAFANDVGFSQIKGLISTLLRDCMVPSFFSRNARRRIIRGRKTKPGKLFTNVGELSYPPTQQIKSYGRCNRPGQAMLYASEFGHLDSLFSELGPVDDDTIVVGLAESSACLIDLYTVGQVDSLRRTGRARLFHEETSRIGQWVLSLPEHARLRMWLMDALLADYFSRRRETDMLYRLTSAATEVILEDRNLHGLMYHSVAHTGGTNYALRAKFFDDNFRWIGASAFLIKRNLGYGIFERQEIARSAHVEQDGRILWETDSRNFLPFKGQSSDGKAVTVHPITREIKLVE